MRKIMIDFLKIIAGYIVLKQLCLYLIWKISKHSIVYFNSKVLII